ncbi:unnamed protein product [Trichobilharzia regenti]|nr:unnamed protein product [Trichobilharzia regenti]
MSSASIRPHTRPAATYWSRLVTSTQTNFPIQWPVVLLYLHHEESPYTQEFVTKILCSTNDDTLKQQSREQEEQEEKETVQERSFDYHHSYKHRHHHHDHHQQQQQRHQHQGKKDKQNLHRREHFHISNDEENAENVTEEKMSTGLNDALSDKLNDFNNDVILPQPSNSSVMTCESNLKENNNDESSVNLSNSTHKPRESVKIRANLNLSNACTSDNLNIKTQSIDSTEHLSYCSPVEEKTSHRNPPTVSEEEDNVKIKTKRKNSLQSPTFFLKSIKHYWKSIVSKNIKNYNCDCSTKENLDHLSGSSHFHCNTANSNEKELDEKKLNASDSQTGSSTIEVVKFSHPLETTTILSQTPGTNINADFATDDIYITNYKSKHFRGLLFERSAGLFPWDCTQIEARAYLISAFPGTRLAQWLKEWKHVR